MKARCFALLLLLGQPALARDTPVKLPNPQVLLDEDAVSIGVVQADPQNAGMKAMLKVAWDTLQASGATSSGIFGVLSSLLRSSTQENLLLGFLPVQAVRVDHLDKDGSDHASIMATAAGYQGYQSLFWNTLLIDSTGTPYPTVRLKTHTLIIRPRPGHDSTQAVAMTRFDGSVYSFPDAHRAEHLLEGHPRAPAEIVELLAEMDPKHYSYGVVLNKHNSLSTFLTWINQSDYARVTQGVGADKLKDALAHIEAVTWEADLVSDDQMNMQVRFRADDEAHAKTLSVVLKQARQILKDAGRARELQMTTVDRDVLLDLQMVGYRQMLVNYVRALKF
jgi:hypothetical protein